MDKLLEQLQERTGLDADQIKSAVSGIADFLGDRLPGAPGDQVAYMLDSDWKPRLSLATNQSLPAQMKAR
jgi:hypothetical protein